MSSKIALLIDAENISYTELPSILKEVPRHGQLVLRAIYGDWQNPHLQKWHDLAEANNFKIRHHTNGNKTKNSADLKLIMDALQVLYTTPIDVFCVVSNDADYVPLCDQIREAKKTVIGIGYKHAADTFIRACDKFIFIGRGEPPVQSLIPLPVEESIAPPKIPTPAPALPMTPPIKLEAAITPPIQSTTPKETNPALVWELLLKAFTNAPKDSNRWVTLTALGQALSKVETGFKTSTYGHPTLSKLLEKMPDFIEFQGDSVRLKTHDPSKQSKPSTKLEQPPDIRKILTEAFARAEKDANRWAKLSSLGNILPQVQAKFKTNTYGHSTLSKLLQSMPDFVELRGKGGDAAARLKK